ncbi:hypothetical protein KAR28_04470 [Candidatus Parcubacteria bacterium]|nr:hypothetical protein [Candidatus Parcubacteria bacterium]
MKKSKEFSKTKITYLGSMGGSPVNGYIDKDTGKAYVACKCRGVDHKVEIIGSWENKKHLQSAVFALEQEIATTKKRIKKEERRKKLEEAKLESEKNKK